MRVEYRKEIIRRYGEGVDLELEEEVRQIKKYTPQDLTNLEKEYEIKIEKLMEGRNAQILITETPKHHVSISHIIYLMECLSLTDKLEIKKEIGSGYFVKVIEGKEVKIREDS